MKKKDTKTTVAKPEGAQRPRIASLFITPSSPERQSAIHPALHFEGETAWIGLVGPSGQLLSVQRTGHELPQVFPFAVPE